MAEAPKHLRQRIREALVTLLKEKHEGVGEKVHSGRAKLLTETDLPAADVDFGRFPGRPDGGEIRSEPGNADATRLLERRSIMTLSVSVADTEGYLDQIDDIFLAYEPAIAEDNTLGGLCVRIAPLGEPRIVPYGEGDQVVVRAEMPFEVEYLTLFNAPASPA